MLLSSQELPKSLKLEVNIIIYILKDNVYNQQKNTQTKIEISQSIKILPGQNVAKNQLKAEKVIRN